jgi:uncharacterized protein (DUF1778 family)
MATTRTIKKERLEARLTREQKRVIERAAEIRGLTTTDFVLSSVQQAAAQVFKEAEILYLRDDARQAFVDALLRPPAPNASLIAAARRYRSRVRH